MSALEKEVQGSDNGNTNLVGITGHHTPQKFSRPAGLLEERKEIQNGSRASPA